MKKTANQILPLPILYTKARYLLCLSFLLAFCQLPAQYFFAYSDTLGNLYTYEDGYIRRMDQRPVLNYKFGTHSAAFITKLEHFKVSYSSGSQLLADNKPLNFNYSRSMMVFELSNVLYAYWNGKIEKLSFFNGEYSFHDSLVCFLDRTNAFKVFYDGTIYNLNQVAVNNYKVFRNVCAYNTQVNIFKVFYRGKVRTLEQYEITDYQVGMNTVGYLDQAGRLKVYNESRVFDVEELTPNFYTVADDMVLYHTRNNDFKVFYKDSAYRLETFLPDKYWIQDGLVYYLDENNRLKVFDRGKLQFVAFFLPQAIKVFNRTLAFLDNYKHLLVYRDGEIKDVSNEAVNNFWLNGDLIVYHAQVNELVFVGKGNPYRIKYNWKRFY